MGRSTPVPRIVLGDATPMQCELLANALRKDREFHVLATAADSKQLLRCINEFEPNIAVLSVDLQDGPPHGIECPGRDSCQLPAHTMRRPAGPIRSQLGSCCFPEWCTWCLLSSPTHRAASQVPSDYSPRSDLGGHQGDELRP